MLDLIGIQISITIIDSTEKHAPAIRNHPRNGDHPKELEFPMTIPFSVVKLEALKTKTN